MGLCTRFPISCHIESRMIKLYRNYSIQAIELQGFLFPAKIIILLHHLIQQGLVTIKSHLTSTPIFTPKTSISFSPYDQIKRKFHSFFIYPSVSETLDFTSFSPVQGTKTGMKKREPRTKIRNSLRKLFNELLLMFCR